MSDFHRKLFSWGIFLGHSQGYLGVHAVYGLAKGGKLSEDFQLCRHTQKRKKID